MSSASSFQHETLEAFSSQCESPFVEGTTPPPGAKGSSEC